MQKFKNYLAYQDGFIKYAGNKNIKLAYASKSRRKWKINKKIILKPRPGYFDSGIIQLLNPVVAKNEILLVYFKTNPLRFGAALLSNKNPEELLWRSANPFWESKEKFVPLGVARIKESLIIFFKDKSGKKIKVSIPFDHIFGFVVEKPILSKSCKNPILKPIPGSNWESQYVFNPAAIYLKGRIHLLYRSIGDQSHSVLGYSASEDGIHFDERHPDPIFVSSKNLSKQAMEVNTPLEKYFSGGSFYGCEDPRITCIEDKIYMLCTVFDGYTPPKVALTSIKTKDFLNKEWKWKKPVIISHPTQVNKNWVIFPEKIKGKFAILHSICPKILIKYVDSLNFNGKTYIKSFYHGRNTNSKCWDSWVRGAGPPPIKTPAGWLLLYHAMNIKDMSKYKIGAMLLDLKNPSKIICRSEHPILEPDMDYENEGFKSGVVYACGSVVVGDELYVYYGGADSVICVATTKLSSFLKNLINAMPIKLRPLC